MNVRTEKIEHPERSLQTGNEALDELPAHVKAGIERAKLQADAGLLTPHEEVMKKYIRHL